MTAGIARAIGIVPSANLNIRGPFPSLVEPIHGSTSDITGKETANPTGAILAGAFMLEHVGYPEAGARKLAALEDSLASGMKIRELSDSA